MAWTRLAVTSASTAVSSLASNPTPAAVLVGASQVFGLQLGTGWAVGALGALRLVNADANHLKLRAASVVLPHRASHELPSVHPG